MRTKQTVNEKKMVNSNAGFTLIEIMVVMIIIGLLATVTSIKVVGIIEKSRRKAAAIQIRSFKNSSVAYYLDNSRYPTTEQGLQALAEKPASSPVPKNYSPGGYIEDGKIPNDPWDNEYVYFSPGAQGGDYSIESYARDGLDGGEGWDRDVESWNLDEP